MEGLYWKLIIIILKPANDDLYVSLTKILFVTPQILLRRVPHVKLVLPTEKVIAPEDKKTNILAHSGDRIFSVFFS